MAQRSCKSPILLALLLLLPCSAVLAENSPSISIHTDFQDLRTKATWLIIVYDRDSPAVYPYLFELDSRHNNFLIYTNSSHYRVVSVLELDTADRKKTNFCNFRAGYYSFENLELSVSGTLTSHVWTTKCVVTKYKM